MSRIDINIHSGCQSITKAGNQNAGQRYISLLRDLLLGQDELAEACHSFVGLLVSILSLPVVPIGFEPNHYHCRIDYNRKII